MSEERLTAELAALIGENGLVALAEAAGGTRLYVPAAGPVAGLDAAASAALSRRFAGSTLRVPLARSLRARQYRAAGQSNAAIARKLGLTETGVDKLFARMADRPAKGDPRQSDLFS